jgi:hypothetical protein
LFLFNLSTSTKIVFLATMFILVGTVQSSTVITACIDRVLPNRGSAYYYYTYYYLILFNGWITAVCFEPIPATAVRGSCFIIQ